jgi:hypothetical protein
MFYMIVLSCLFMSQTDQVLVQNPKGKESQALPASLKPEPSKPANIYCLAEGVKPLRQPHPGSVPSGYPEPRYLESFTFVDVYQGEDGKKYFLLTKGEPGNEGFKYCGWVPAELVLQGEECMKDPLTDMQRKALIVSTPETLADKNKIENIKPKKGPGNSYSALDPMRYYNIMFVFNEAKDSKTGEKYICLGFQPIFDRQVGRNNQVEKTIAGWVPEKDVYLWNTREAIQWETGSTPGRKEPVKVFRTREDAIKYSNNPKSPDSVKPVIEEGFDSKGKSPEWKKDKSRYPLLSMLQEEKFTDQTLGELSNVGIIGDFVSPDGNIDQDKLDEMRRKISGIMDDLKYTEILLVIDDTGSMDKYFKNVVPNWIDGIIKGLQDQGDQKIRIALCFYNDITFDGRKGPISNLDKAVHFEDWEEINPSVQSKVIEKLRSHQGTGGGDVLEQMLHGLKLGLEKSSTKVKRNSRKLCIILGDFGNHVSENCDQDIEKEIEAIASRLTPRGGTPWEFLALQAPPDQPGDEKLAEYKLFPQQSQKILEAIKKRRKEEIERVQDENKNVPGLQLPEPGTGAVFTAEDIEKVVGELKNSYQKTSNLQKELQDQALKLARGNLAPTAKILPELQEMLLKERLDVSMLQREGQQVFLKGWVWDQNSNQEKQIRQNYLLRKQEIESLNRLLEGIDTVPQTVSGIQEFLQAKLLDLASGDKNKIANVNLETMFKKMTGLKTKSKLFQVLNNQILPDQKENALTDELLRLKKKGLLIKDVLNKEESEYVKKEVILDNGKKEKIWEKTTTKPKDRIFKVPGSDSVEWVWLDSQEEFP